MKKKLRIGILFGGRSGEHEVSSSSAASILKAIDRKKYDVTPIGITKQGSGSPRRSAILLARGGFSQFNPLQSARCRLVQQSGNLTQTLDVIFPVLHGTFGEDGTIPGPLRARRSCVCRLRVLGSATGMDKATMNSLRRSRSAADATRCSAAQRVEE